jgi:hypothetical protein
MASNSKPSSAPKRRGAAAAARLKRSVDPPGYWLGGRFHAGFPDDPELTRGQRLRIAGWGRAIAPKQLSDEQRQLLDGFAPEPAAARARAEALAGYRESPYWQSLSAEQQALAGDPSTHPALEGAIYPLRVSQIAALVGASVDQIRHWDQIGLLPARRTAGGQRRFYAAAATRAFFLAGMDQPNLSILRQVNAGKGRRLLLGMSGVFREQASAASQGDRELLLRAAADLQDLGLSRAS